MPDEMADMALAEETCARREAEEKLAAAWRVAVEAMRLLTREQLIELRRRCDALEVGDSDGRDDGTG